MTLNRPFDSDTELLYPCPECAKPMILLPHSFKPPKKTDDKKWETVRFLIDNGFYYQHIYERNATKNGESISQNRLAYPENIRDAEEFVKKYKSQARMRNK